MEKSEVSKASLTSTCQRLKLLFDSDSNAPNVHVLRSISAQNVRVIFIARQLCTIGRRITSMDLA
jgi:hypothetical protein